MLLSGIVEDDRVKLVKGDNEALHPGQRTDIYIDNIKTGYFGQLHPNICSNLEFVRANFPDESNFGEN